MAEEIYNGTHDHEVVNNEAINDIVTQLIKRPSIHKISSPIVMEEGFKSAFKCVPEKTASSYSGRGVHNYKACSKGSQDGIADIVAAVNGAMVKVPLAVGFCAERWKQAVDVMLDNIPSVP
jgi:hypothetical protein